MTVVFAPAQKTQAKLRLAVTGPAGSGKTFTALRIAKGISERVALIDTEAGSASKYADQFAFAQVTLTSFHPQNFIDAIKAAEADFDVLVIDSLSHAWMGKDGVMEQVDRRKASERNQFAAWKEPSGMHSALVEAILHARLHVIATMRSKMEYAQEQGQVKRLGMAPVQREGMEYEFDVVLDMDAAHNGKVSKSRIASLADAVLQKPGEDLGKQLAAWLSEGAPMQDRQEESRRALNADSAGSNPAPATPLDEMWHAANADTSAQGKFTLTKAKALLKERGFTSWADFTARHTPEDAVALTLVLAQPALV